MARLIPFMAMLRHILPTAIGDNLLLETGDALLLEDGFKLILE